MKTETYLRSNLNIWLVYLIFTLGRKLCEISTQILMRGLIFKRKVAAVASLFVLKLSVKNCSQAIKLGFKRSRSSTKKKYQKNILSATGFRRILKKKKKLSESKSNCHDRIDYV